MILVLAGMIWLAANIGFFAGILFKLACDRHARARLAREQDELSSEVF